LFCRNRFENCGSEPAREGGVSGDITAGCDGLFASKLTPDDGLVDRQPGHKSVVDRAHLGNGDGISRWAEV